MLKNHSSRALSQRATLQHRRISALRDAPPKRPVSAFELLENRLLFSSTSVAHLVGPVLTIHRDATHVSPTAPKATLLSARGIDDQGAVSLTLRVRYTDRHGLDLTTLGTDDVTVGNGLVLDSAVTVSSGRRNAVVTYVATGADDPSAAVNGRVIYAAYVSAASIFNTGGIPAAGATLGTFALKLKPAPVTSPIVTPTAPVAQTISAPYLTEPGASSVDVQIQYTDTQGVDLNSIVPSNLLLGGGSLAASGVTTSATDGNKTVVATYTIAAPNGTFGVNDNGSYLLELNGSADVRDVDGLAAIEGPNSLGAMHIIIEPAVPTATPGPGVTVSTFGVSSTTVTVTYSDAIAIDTGTISATNLGFASASKLPVTGVSQVSSDGGKTVAATYTLGAPDGVTFKHTDNGVYQIEINAGTVSNSSGHSVPATSGEWETATINVPDPSTAAPPTATLVSAPYLAQPDVAQVQIQIAYHDELGVDLSSLSAANVLIVDGHLNVSAVSFSSSNAGRDVLANYTIAAPSGVFTVDDDGSYSYVLSTTDPVRNIAGLPVPADALGFVAFHIVISGP